MEKDVPSTEGQKRTLETSEMMQLRLKENISQKNIDSLKIALQNRDFQIFSEITMKESNSLHAVCLDSYPPIFYMNETSKDIVSLIT